ncbi:MAG TPA: hypothetical protein VKU41_29055 [Polyangiaceae bacterium]|nr:hypothetical protein [Polyangiaceae bacterium]
MSDRKRPPAPPASDRLMARIDGALARWPLPARIAEREAHAAEQVVARLGDEASGREGPPEGGPTEEDIFRSPLPVTLAEIQAVTARGKDAPSPRRDDGAALREIAKLANRPAAPKTNATNEDSGVIVLAELMAKGQAAEGPSEGRREPPREGVQASAGRRRHFEAWIGVGGAIAGAAVAAGIFLVIQGSGRQRSSPTGTASSPAVVIAAVTANASSPPARPPELVASDAPVDPSGLPVAVAVATREPAALVPTRPSGSPRAGAAARGPASVTSEVASAAPPAPSDTPVDLGESMRVAAGPAATPLSAGGGEAPPDPGSVPRRPSLGAVQGALGAVMPAARLCLGPDDPICRASITFQSDGRVESVSLEGGSVAGALGKPAEACIRAALSRARVPPFAQPVFTVPATVRPN